MAHRIVKEVTQPVIGPDGNTVVFAPGEQFGEDHVLPDGVPWKLVIAEVPDEPAPKPKAEVPDEPVPAPKPKAEVPDEPVPAPKPAAAAKPAGKH